MSRISLFMLVGGIAAVAALGGYLAGGRAGEPMGEGAHAQAAAPAGGRAVLYYRNPMGLPDTSPVPKKDSMGMDYVPVYADDSPDDTGVVKVSPERIQTLGVKTAVVGREVIDAAVRAVGRVEVNERAIFDVAPKFEGWIERLHVNATGDPVRRGQPLFTVYSPELVSARKEQGIAEQLQREAAGGDPAAIDSARRLAEAAAERLRNWDLPAAALRGGEHVSFVAPASGIVLEKKAVAGMRFLPGETIFRIADLSTVWVIADLYEQDLDRVRVGQRVDVMIDAFPDRHFEGRLTYLYPTLNTPTRTTPARLELANRDGLLRPGMFAHIEVASAGAEPRLAVPLSAVIDKGHQQVVLVAAEAGRYKPQAVQLGMRGRDFVEVLGGLEGGERVVVAANFLIDAESNLKAALAGFSPPEDAAAKVYETRGAVEEIDLVSGSATFRHEPIAELQWPAMSMEFKLASPELLQGIVPNEPIRFSFEDRGDGEFVVVRVERNK